MHRRSGVFGNTTFDKESNETHLSLPERVRIKIAEQRLFYTENDKFVG